MAIANPQSDFVFPSGRELQRRVRRAGERTAMPWEAYPMPYKLLGDNSPCRPQGLESLSQISAHGNHLRRLDA